MNEKPEVLFVCVHNAGRSQMAAALLDHHAHGAVLVRSAGSTPADEINPTVVQALSETGIDIADDLRHDRRPRTVRDRVDPVLSGRLLRAPHLGQRHRIRPS